MPVVAIVGPTGTGKSDLAVELALRLGGEVVNADSMQVYRGMDIGTAKLTPAERRGVPHHVLDVWDVSEPASVVAYRDLARAAIDDIAERGKVPILVGGSGLYVRAVIDDIDFPGTDPAVRARLLDELADVGASEMHSRLVALDPEAAAAILPGNGRRIVRALEVIEITGRPFAARLPKARHFYPTVTVGLDRDDLEERLALRVDDMWNRGLVAEAAALPGLWDAPTASRALGYQQALAQIAGDIDEEEARRQTLVATRKFAKRQRRWFGRTDGIHWVTATDRAHALEEVLSWMVADDRTGA